MKHKDLEFCAVCGNGVMHNGQITFYRVRIDHMVVNVNAVQRAHGLEQLLGGHAGIANAMGPDEDLAAQASSSAGLICQECALLRSPQIAEINEAFADTEPDHDN